MEKPRKYKEFRAGDVVELQSGSAPMTVVHTTVAFTTTTWHASGEKQTETYPTICLRFTDRQAHP